MNPRYGVKQYIEEITNHLRPSVGRLMDLVKKQYGCDLRYRILEVIESAEDLEIRKALETNGPRPLARNQIIYIPVRQDGEVMGAAEIANGVHLNDEQVHRIGELVKLLIQPQLVFFERLSTLRTLESQLDSIGGETNVVPIGRLRTLRQIRKAVDEIEFKSLTPEPLRPKRRVRFQFPVLIHASNQEDLQKMAFELHYHSHRMAFIQLDQLKASDTLSAQTFRDLGPVTVYIPDISSLSVGQQKALLEYLDGFRHEDSPQIIAGTLVDYKQLVATGVPDPALVRKVAVAYLQMTKPFAYYREKNIVDFFYNSLVISSH